jgi:catalase-peroxidase
MGPRARYLGPEVPTEVLIWQDPLPQADHPLVTEADVASLNKRLLASGLSVSQLVKTAWSAASSFRQSDKRGGANGARLRLSPQRTWEVNEPAALAKVLATLESIRHEFNAAQGGNTRISLADLFVLGGCAGVEEAARRAGHPVHVPFTPGRTDATQEQTDVDSFAALEPLADGFRNYVRAGLEAAAAEMLIDRANLLALTAPEMTALIGGLRALRANHGNTPHGVLTHRPELLTNDFFMNLLDMRTKWRRSERAPDVFEGVDRVTGEFRWTATVVDLVFGSNSQLRALAEVYASADAESAFVRAFVQAWTKVMDLDRFDLRA